MTYDIHARLQDIADESFGPFPTEPEETLCGYIELGIKRWRRQFSQVEVLLQENGCDCECECGAEDHSDACERCLACRISDVIAAR